MRESRFAERFFDRESRAFLLGAALSLIACALGIIALRALRGDRGEAAAQLKPQDFQRGFFLRPGIVSPGGTCEVHIDHAAGSFSAGTTVESSSPEALVVARKLRHSGGMTVELAVSAKQPEGELILRFRTPKEDGTSEALEATLLVAARPQPGPALAFLNLPAGDRLVSEGPFAHLRLGVEGDGPFLVEFGVRGKPYWCSRPWNAVERRVAEERGLAIEPGEVEDFEVALPEKVNIVDVVAVDRNGRESWAALVIESNGPLDMDAVREVGLLDQLHGEKPGFFERLFQPRTAWAACGPTNPAFSFYSSSCVGTGQCRDDNGMSPLMMTESSCQGTACNTCSCCDSDAPLDSVSGGSGGGGYEGRPDGYAPPSGMLREHGKVFPHSGEFKYTVTDLSVPVPELDFAITRTYRSQVAYHSRLGRNWDMNVFARYLRYGTVSGTTASASGDMYYFLGNGRRDRYPYLGNNSFQSPDGFYDKFNFSPSAASQEIRYKDGGRRVFTEYQVGPNAVFAKLSKLYGRKTANYLSFNYNLSGALLSISSSAGVTLNFAYTGGGYLSRIYQYSDPTHEVLYFQDVNVSHGTLMKVKYAQSTFYEYSGPNLLAYNDRKTAIYEYDLENTDSRRFNLLKIYDGRGNADFASLAHTQAYPIVELSYYGGPPTSYNFDRVENYTTDPAGADSTRTRYSFTSYSADAGGAPLQTNYEFQGWDGQDAYVTLKRYELTFNGAPGGLLKRRFLTDAGLEIAAWNYRRDCSCNQATSTRDPVGRIETRVFDGYGNMTKRKLHYQTDDCSDGDCFDDIVPNSLDIVYLYKYQNPNYVTSSQYGRLLESAAPNVVIFPNEDINNVPLASKTRYTYNTSGDLTKLEPPAFHHDYGSPGGFGDLSAYQPSIEYTYVTFGTGQVDTETVKLDLPVLKTTSYGYYTSGYNKHLVQTITVNPGWPDASVRSYGYNIRRDLTGFTDPRNNMTSFQWTGDRLLSTIQPPGSAELPALETRFRYDPNQNRVGEDRGWNEGSDRVAAFTAFDRLNRLISVKRELAGDADPLIPNAALVESTREYDPEGQLLDTWETGGKRGRADYSYFQSAPGKARLLVSEYGSGTGFQEVLLAETAFDEAGREVYRRAHFDASNYAEARNLYDAFGRLELQVTSPDSTDFTSVSNGAFYAVYRTHDKNGNLLKGYLGEDNDNGASALLLSSYTLKRVMEKFYDELDRAIREADSEIGVNPPPGVVALTKHKYGGQIAVRRRVLESGNADTTFDYDMHSRLTDIHYPDGSSLHHEMDTSGNATEVHRIEFDQLLQTTSTLKTLRVYNALDQVSEEKAQGSGDGSNQDYERRLFAYDVRGNLKTNTLDVKGSTNELVTTYTYDGLDRLTRTDYPLGIANGITYDDLNRTVTRSDGLGQSTVYESHAMLDAMKKITYENDQPGDPDNRWLDYDRQGRLIHESFAKAAQPSSWEIDYSYDLLGRPLARTNNAAQAGEEKNADFSWDYQGRLLGAKTRLSGTVPPAYDTEVARSYNALNLLSEVQTVAGAPASFTIRTDGGGDTGYDWQGRRTRIEYPNDTDLDATGSSSKRVLGMSYDSNDRLTSLVETGVAPLAAYAYGGPGSKVRKLWLYNPDSVGEQVLRKVMEYDHLNRPLWTDYQYGSEPSPSSLVKYTETWGDGSWIAGSGETRRVGVFQRSSFKKSTWGGTSRAYEYDAMERLLKAARDGQANNFTYNPANNRTQMDSTAYSYNSSNELTGVSGAGALCGVAHDARGNLSRKDRCGGIIEDFAYDLYNRLVSYASTATGETWTYTYDGLGRRVKKARSGGSKTHTYYHDGARAVLELIDQATDEVREYIHGIGIDEVLLEQLQDGGTPRSFWPLVDSLGNVRDLGDLNGSSPRVRVAYDYAPYGSLTEETQATGTAVAQDVLFTGRILDRESGMYFYRARHQDPMNGRFLQRDPIEIWGDEANFGNGYGYVGNDPVNLFDQFGLQAVVCDECDDPKKCKCTIYIAICVQAKSPNVKNLKDLNKKLESYRAQIEQSLAQWKAEIEKDNASRKCKAYLVGKVIKSKDCSKEKKEKYKCKDEEKELGWVVINMRIQDEMTDTDNLLSAG